MVRGFNSRTLLKPNSLLLPPPTKLAPKPMRTLAPYHHPLPSYFHPHDSHAILSNSLRQPSDKMPQRASLAFTALSPLLRRTPVDPALLASAHCLSLKIGAISDISVRTSLLTAYARANALDSSLALFDEVDTHDVISWNAMINALVINSCFETSINLFEDMVREFGRFDSTTLVIVLSAVSRACDLRYGRVLHGTIVKRRLEWDVQLCNALTDMYAKCNDLSSSESVFAEAEFKDGTSWNTMINGCVCNGFPKKSALYFREMSHSDVCPDQVSLSGVISACSCSEELSKFGESVHGWVIKLGYEGGSYISVGNSLISFYSRCMEIDAAEKVFRDLTYKNIVSWNSMIKGQIENERVYQAFDLFRKMQSRPETHPDDVTLVTIIPNCGAVGVLRDGKAIHGFTIRKELAAWGLSISNSLLDMYIHCDDLTSAELLFKTMPTRDLISWNTMISGYASNSLLKEDAQNLFCQLLQTGLRCNFASLVSILPSCSSPENLYFGKTVHCWMLKYGFANILSAVNALMLMYIHCGDIKASSLLFESILHVSDTVSWNTIIVGFAQNGYHMDALEAFKFMHFFSCADPDPITLVSLLSVCGNLELMLCGKSVHGLAIKRLTVSDVRVRNGLITMYFRCGDGGSAELAFRASGEKNLCSWNCMISGFAQHREGARALEFFRSMASFQLNEISLVGVLCACTQLESLRHGSEVHGHVLRLELQGNPFISSALVDMYSKCGKLNTAVRVFETSVEKSVASWNSMISGYGFHGHGRKAIELFSKMTELGVKATKSTFIALLSACSHSGLVDEGWNYYKQMSEEYGIEATVEHHVCIVDMLGRAGKIGEAYNYIEKMPIQPVTGVWGALLSACKDHADFKMGKSIAERLFRLEPEEPSYYVSLSNLYSNLEMWSDSVNVRSVLQNKGLIKPPGSSSIDTRVKGF